MCKHIWTNVCPSITGVYCDWCFYVVLKIISLMWQGRALRWEGTDIILTSCICAFASYALYNPPLDRGKLHVGVTITAQSVASDPCFNVDLTTQSFPPHWEEQGRGFLTISRLIKGVTCYCPLTTLGFYSIYAAWSSLDRYHAYIHVEGPDYTAGRVDTTFSLPLGLDDNPMLFDFRSSVFQNSTIISFAVNGGGLWLTNSERRRCYHPGWIPNSFYTWFWAGGVASPQGKVTGKQYTASHHVV